MKKEQFNVGDKVFAKIKGYPFWPAIILEGNGKKFKVRFYGTGEIGQINSDGLFYYTRNKAKLLKPSKRKDFNDSVKQIEEAIEEAGTDGDPYYGMEKNDSVLNDSTSITDSESSFSKKRKRSLSVAKSVDEASSNKFKRGKISSGRQSVTTPLSKDKICEIGTKSEEEKSESNSELPKEVEENPESTKTEAKVIVPEELPEKEVENDIVYEETPQVEPTELPEQEDYILEKELEAYIAYANYIENHKDLYLKLPLSQRNTSKNQVLPFVFNGKCIGIKLHKEHCQESFPNEYTMAMYDKQISQTALELKSTFTFEKVQESPETYFIDLEKDQNDLNYFWEKKMQKIKEDILNTMKVECKLLEIDSKIKNCLNLEKADPEEAISLLDDMLDLEVTSVMLKKHAHVVDMVRRLRKYIGNLDSWNLTEVEAAKFKADAEKVRGSALKLHVKFMKIIGRPTTSQSFWDHFNHVANKFRDDTKDLTDMEFYLLTSWPYSRENFLNNYYIKDISFKLPTQIDTMVEKQMNA